MDSGRIRAPLHQGQAPAKPIQQELATDHTDAAPVGVADLPAELQTPLTANGEKEWLVLRFTDLEHPRKEPAEPGPANRLSPNDADKLATIHVANVPARRSRRGPATDQ